MQILRAKAVLKLKANLVVLAAIFLVSCSPPGSDQRSDQPPVVKVEKPFAPAGSIEMQLDGGTYVIRASPDEHVRVSFAGNTGNATAELATSGKQANLAVRDTPHNNFRATVEVPATVDLTIHLTAGNLEVAAITGNKDIESQAGNVGIAIPNSNDYGTVDAAVKVGNLKAGPFGNSGSGLSPHLQWSGPGKYKLRVSLNAGNLELKH